MKFERPRARRYPFVASIELTDLAIRDAHLEQTSDLNLFGCHVNTEEVLPTLTTVMLRISTQARTYGSLVRSLTLSIA